MMSTRRFLCLFALLLVSASLSARGGTLAGTTRHDTWLIQESLERLSIGGTVDFQSRKVDLDQQGLRTLKARVYSGYVGIDLTEWLNVFGTLGQSEAALFSDDTYLDNKLKWSTGLQAGLWHFDVEDPTFLAGRLSINAMGEYSQYKSADSYEDISWREWFASATVGYEIFVTKLADIERYPYSIAMYVGPAFSSLSGDDNNPIHNASFSQDKSVGLAAGLDLFISHNLSAGGQLIYFDDTTYSVSLRYHF